MAVVVMVYINNILIFTKIEEGHDEIVQEVFVTIFLLTHIYTVIHSLVQHSAVNTQSAEPYSYSSTCTI